MTISTVSIRPFREDDVETGFEAVIESLAELRPWMPWSHNYQLVDAQRWAQTAKLNFDQRVAFEFVIVGTSDAFLGGCGLNQIKAVDQVANVGYWVRSSQTGRGVATRAVRQLVQWAFAETDLARLEIVVAVENLASRKVAENAGAQQDAILRKRLFLGGRSCDAALYSIVRPD